MTNSRTFKGLPTMAIATVGLILAVRAQAGAGTAGEGPLATSSGGLDTGNAVNAAPATAQALGEVVVTATKTAERADKVPISISAYTPAVMDTLGVRSVKDIAQLTPGLDFSQVNRATSNISIRGISSTVGAGTTGVYIDDTPVEVRNLGYFPNNTYPMVFDLARIEVLRGPQGTLFGASSEGGTVRFITPSPSLTQYSAYARAEASATQDGQPNSELGAAVGGPIVTDELGFRISIWTRHDGGWVDRVNDTTGAVTEPDSNYQNSYVARAALTWAPSGGLRITPAIYFQQLDVNDTNLMWATLSDPDREVMNNGFPQRQPGIDRFVLPSLKVEYDFGSATFTSNTGYFDRTATTALDYSTVVPSILSGNAYTTVPGYTSLTNVTAKQQNITEEARLQSNDANARLTWVAGLYFAHQKQSEFEGIGGQGTELLSRLLFGATTEQVFGMGNIGPYSFIGINQAVDKEVAGFGQLGYRLTDALRATVGVRVSRDEFQFENYQTGPFNTGTTQADNSRSNTPVTPKGTLSYQITSKTLVYASVAKGYRIGGGNAGLPVSLCDKALGAIGLTGAPKTFAPDSLWSYEVGAKGGILNGRLRYAASVFYIDWTHIQQPVYLSRCGFKYIDNLGSASSRGADLQWQLQVARGFTLSGSLSYDDAKYSDTVYPGLIHGSGAHSVLVSAGDSLGIAPWKATLTGEYDLALPRDRVGYVSGTYLFTGHDSRRTPFLDPASVSYDPAMVSASAQTLVNVRAGVRFNGWDVSAFADNLLNSHTIIARQDETVENPILHYAIQRPRVVGITVTYAY
jgi:outer membrane receptor protein involved in Fe transport